MVGVPGWLRKFVNDAKLPLPADADLQQVLAALRLGDRHTYVILFVKTHCCLSSETPDVDQPVVDSLHERVQLALRNIGTSTGAA